MRPLRSEALAEAAATLLPPPLDDLRGVTVTSLRRHERGTHSHLSPGIMDEAFMEAKLAGHEAGRQEGYAEGYAQGQARARAEVEQAVAALEAHVTSALAALAAAATAFEARETTAVEQVEESVAAAALELATVIVGREVAVAESPGRDAIARGLALVPVRQRHVVVHLHPDDLATLPDPHDWAANRELELVADAAVEPGGALLEFGTTTIDAQLGPAIERVTREVLG